MDNVLWGLPLEVLVTIITVSAGILSAILTYFLGVSKTKRDLIVEFDKKVLEERLFAYRELWKLFLPLALYNPPQEPTYEKLIEMSALMSRWYHEVGGIFLTFNSRKKYFDVQECIQELVKDPDRKAVVSGSDQEIIVKKISLLRTKLSDDLRSRLNFKE